MKFEDFHLAPSILKSIQKQGFKKPTDIQYKSINPILQGEDVLAIAQTGTGKTAAFVIPVVDILSRQSSRRRPEGVRCLVMVPTHELALQICSVFAMMGKYTSLRFLAIHGGVEQDPQITSLNTGVDVLVATPGRLFDLVHQGHLKLERVEILILDEADHMLDLGFIKDIRDLLKFVPKRRQTLFFSATIDSNIKKLAYSLVNKPIRIQISPKDPVSKNVDHSVVFVTMDDKRFFLERLVMDHPESKMLVFVRTKVRAERVCAAMLRVGIPSLTIHSDKEHKERNLAMEQFRSGDVKMLIATDVSARGIDIPDVDYVVNYDLPDKVENYVHRVGRTGRGIKRGIAVSFCSEEEKPVLALIEEYLTKQVAILELGKDEYNHIVLSSTDATSDWKSVMKEIELMESRTKKKKTRK